MSDLRTNLRALSDSQLLELIQAGNAELLERKGGLLEEAKPAINEALERKAARLELESVGPSDEQARKLFMAALLRILASTR
jgi:hypothetical protein